MSNTIILDCDGVLLNWRDTYVDWLKKFNLIEDENASEYYFKKFIRIPGDEQYRLKDFQFADALSEIFNQTFLLKKLPPVRDAVQAIKYFHQNGYVLKVVSSYTNQYEAMKSREQNLISVFGNVFQEIASLPLHSSKKQYLSDQDPDSIFIEDSLSHLLDAYACGFNPKNLFMIPYPWNSDDQTINTLDEKGIRRKSWINILHEIKG